MSDESTATLWRCLSCGHIDTETAPADLFACGTCGEQFTRRDSAKGSPNQCPLCRRFCRRAARETCVRCVRGELEAIRFMRCMVCGQEHDSKLVPERCGGPGMEGMPVTEMRIAPTDHDEDDLTLPAAMSIASVLKWMEDDTTLVTRWRLNGRGREGQACILTMRTPVDGPSTARLGCTACENEQKGTLNEMLAMLAHGAHRHGETGVRIEARTREGGRR